jgi:multidrug efflux pump subunit AcrA (membrane-fusion protein)
MATKSTKFLLPALVVGLLLSFGFGVKQLTARATPTQPEGTLLPVARPESAGVAAEGRLAPYPGADVIVGTEVAGRVLRLAVEEKAVVHKGDVLAELDSSEPRAALAEAKAQAAQAEAELRYDRKELARQEQLVAGHAATGETRDRMRYQVEAAEARLALTEATVRRLEANLAKFRIVAPIDGVVIARLVEPGATLTPGTRLYELADLSRTRIEAEVDEYDSAKIALGAPVRITAEGYAGASWKGQVEEIPDSVLGRQLKPQDPGKPQDTRVLLVKVAIKEPTPLRLWQRVELRIEPIKAPGPLAEK